MTMSPRHAGPRGQRGTALIEFALVLPLILLLTILVIDFTLAFTAKNLLVQAAREGARRACIASVDADSVRRTVRQVVSVTAMDANTVTTEVTNPTSNQVTVSVQAPFSWINPSTLKFFGIWTADTDTLRASCTMAVESSNP